MRIEDHWEDVFIYYVRFKVNQDGRDRIICKSIILYAPLTNLEVTNLIFSKFNNVASIKSIDFYDDGLLVKKIKNSVAL